MDIDLPPELARRNSWVGKPVGFAPLLFRESSWNASAMEQDDPSLDLPDGPAVELNFAANESFIESYLSFGPGVKVTGARINFDDVEIDKDCPGKTILGALPIIWYGGAVVPGQFDNGVALGNVPERCANCRASQAAADAGNSYGYSHAYGSSSSSAGSCLAVAEYKAPRSALWPSPLTGPFPVLRTGVKSEPYDAMDFKGSSSCAGCQHGAAVAAAAAAAASAAADSRDSAVMDSYSSGKDGTVTNATAAAAASAAMPGTKRTAAHKWARVHIMNSRNPNAAEDPHKRVGIYTVAERRKIIQRWRLKRQQIRALRREKRVTYECRSKFAKTRPRIGGRFVSKKMLESMPPELQAQLHAQVLAQQAAAQAKLEAQAQAAQAAGLSNGHAQAHGPLLQLHGHGHAQSLAMGLSQFV